MEYCTGDEIGNHSEDGSFQGGLKSGVFLCALINALCEGLIPKVSTSTQRFKQMENISSFLVALRTEFKMHEADVFGTPDLFEAKDMNQVLNTLCMLHRKVGAREDLAGWVEHHPQMVERSGAKNERLRQQQRRLRWQ